MMKARSESFEDWKTPEESSDYFDFTSVPELRGLDSTLGLTESEISFLARKRRLTPVGRKTL